MNIDSDISYEPALGVLQATILDSSLNTFGDRGLVLGVSVRGEYQMKC